LVVYVVWDRRGDVDDYIPVALAGLREHASRVLVVVNGSLTDAGRAKLEPVADEVLVRDNVGFDIWAHKDALDHVGSGLAEFDEVVLTNDTWFGPVRPYGPVLERMGERAVHFWGMTDHAREEPNPFTGVGVLPYHVQSFWIAVRREMFLSEAWASYWRELPAMPSYFDAVLKHEAVFTEHFTERGYSCDVAYPSADYGFEDASVYAARELVKDGCPVLRVRPFHEWPPTLDRHAVIGRWTLDAAAEDGYPTGLVLQHLARNTAPRDLNAAAGLFDVLTDSGAPEAAAHELRIVVVAHIFYEEMTDEMLDRADTLPGAYDLVVTTPQEEKAAAIRAIIDRRPARGAVEVRVVSNDGRDQSAFLVGCRDILMSDRYDLVVKLHSKKTPQDGYSIGRHFAAQQFDNLLNSPGYTANLINLFVREPGLGLVYPPMIHIGYPTMGRGWWSNKPPFEKLAKQLGIRVPVDEISPLAPYGSMFIGRPESLRLLVEHPWAYDDFGGAEAYRDGGLAHVLERVPSYAAAELGFHTRTVANTEYLAISHTAFEFNFDELSATTPGYSNEQITFIRRAGYVGEGRARDFLRMYLRLHYPQHEARILGALEPDRALGRWVRRVRHPGATVRGIVRRGTRR